MSVVAVLTGDLVESTRFPADQVDGAMQAIRATADALAGTQTSAADARFTRFRGDGWQVCLAQPHLSLRAAVLIQAGLVALGQESRISIGIGGFESLGTNDLSDASGPAFEWSGRGLDDMGSAFRIAIAGTGIHPQDPLIADLLGERMGRWTAAQAEAVALHLAAPDRTRPLQEIGQQLTISAQAVNDRIRGAGGQTIASVLKRWEQMPGHNPWSATHA